MSAQTGAAVRAIDLEATTLREANALLHAPGEQRHWRIVNQRGRHSVAVGLDAEIEVDVEGHVGYYCAGMNQRATVHVRGNAGPGLAENIMSGVVVVDGNASQSAGATGRGAKWSVQDKCQGTLIRVTRGVVAVLDSRTRRTVLVRSGRHYEARPKR